MNSSFYESYSIVVSILSPILIIAVLVLVIFNTIRTTSLMRRYKRLMRGVNNKNLEALLDHYLLSIQSALSKVDAADERQEVLLAQLNKCIQGVGLIRYNPFDEMGSDLSFSLALLDANASGVVISCLFGRQSSSIYAKSIVSGKSTYPLSAEEIEALNNAKATLIIAD